MPWAMPAAIQVHAPARSAMSSQAPSLTRLGPTPPPPGEQGSLGQTHLHGTRFGRPPPAALLGPVYLRLPPKTECVLAAWARPGSGQGHGSGRRSARRRASRAPGALGKALSPDIGSWNALASHGTTPHGQLPRRSSSGLPTAPPLPFFSPTLIFPNNSGLPNGHAECTDITFKIYPGMEHSSCPQEMRDLEEFLRATLPDTPVTK